MPMELQMIVEEGEAVVPRGGLRRELLGARRLVRDEEVLLDLVLHAPEAGLLDSQRREGTRVLPHGATHRLDDLVPFLETEGVEGPERRRGRRDRVVEAREDAASETRARS